MTDYINRDALLKEFLSPRLWNVTARHIELIKNAPTVDAVLVRRGKWNKQYSSGLKVEKGYVSSCCDMWNERRSNFCPNCGADMREVDHDQS